MPQPNLLTDTLFKAVFATPEGAPQLTHLLNALLSQSPHAPFSQVEVLNPFSPTTYLQEKHSILDVKARDGAGRLINIEIQLAPQNAFRERVLYYWAKTYSGQLMAGEPYRNLAPTIAVCLLGPRFSPPGQATTLHRTFRIVEVDSPAGESLSLPTPAPSSQAFSDHLEIHWVDTGALKNSSAADIIQHRDFAWLYHLVHTGESQPLLEDIVRTYEEIRESYLKYNMALSDEQIRTIMDVEVEAERTYISNILDAKLEGVSEGMSKGKAEGKAETLLETAARLKALGIEAQTIAQATGLTLEEINGL